MAIKGLTDQPSVIPAFQRIGKLRKGAARTQEDLAKKRPGKELEYFRFTSDQPEVAAAFTAAYGAQPALVRCYLPYQRAEENFQTWKELWAAGGLLHRCDGETMTVWRKPDGTYSREPQPCPGGCDEVGRLIVVIPELVAAGFVGYVTVETHGLNDLLRIMGVLAQVERETEIARGQADLRGIEFTLRRYQEAISTPDGKGGRARRPKWLVGLEPSRVWVQRQLAAASRQALALPGPLPSQQLDLQVPHAVVDATVNVEPVEDWEPEEYLDGLSEEGQGDTSPAQEGRGAASPVPSEPPVEVPGNGHSNGMRVTRPADAPTVRGWLRARGGWVKGENWDLGARRQPADQQQPPTEVEVKRLAALMNAALKGVTEPAGPVDEKRHAVLRYVFGVESGSALTHAEVKATLAWLEEVKGAWVPGPLAGRECVALYRMAVSPLPEFFGES